MKQLPRQLQECLSTIRASFACINGKDAHQYSSEINATIYAAQDYLLKARNKYYTEMQPTWNKQAKDRADASHRRGKLVTKWCKQNLMVGDIIRLSGTRDRHGIREVIAINGDQVTTHQLDVVERPRIFSSSKTIVVNIDLEPIGVTTHALANVTHVAHTSLLGGDTLPTKGKMLVIVVPVGQIESFKDLDK